MKTKAAIKIIAAATIFFATTSIANAVDFEGKKVDGGGVVLLDYNGVSSKYLKRPTFAKIFGYDYGSSEILQYEAKDYSGNTMRLQIGKEFIAANIEMMEKFLKWAEMATERGDIIQKDIGVVDRLESTPSTKQNKYKFFTAAESAYYLIIEGGSVSSTGSSNWGGSGNWSGWQSEKTTRAAMLDQDGVSKLINKLRKFHNGEIHFTDDSDYM